MKFTCVTNDSPPRVELWELHGAHSGAVVTDGDLTLIADLQMPIDEWEESPGLRLCNDRVSGEMRYVCSYYAGHEHLRWLEVSVDPNGIIAKKVYTHAMQYDWREASIQAFAHVGESFYTLVYPYISEDQDVRVMRLSKCSPTGALDAEGNVLLEDISWVELPIDLEGGDRLVYEAHFCNSNDGLLLIARSRDSDWNTNVHNFIVDTNAMTATEITLYLDNVWFDHPWDVGAGWVTSTDDITYAQNIFTGELLKVVQGEEPNNGMVWAHDTFYHMTEDSLDNNIYLYKLASCVPGGSPAEVIGGEAYWYAAPFWGTGMSSVGRVGDGLGYLCVAEAN